MPVLSDTDLEMVTEIVTEIAKYRGRAFDQTAKGVDFAHAALINPLFRARLAEVRERLEARRETNEHVPIAPMLRELERMANAVLSGWREPD
jgi:hypothetical protein